MKLFAIGMVCMLISGYFIPLAKSQGGPGEGTVHSGIYSLKPVLSVRSFIISFIDALRSRATYVIDAVLALMPFLYLVSNDSTPPRSIYYLYVGKPVRDADLLEHYIEDYEWAMAYREDYWDCSEMSAYLEWFLENKGFHTIFCFDEEHMWLSVEMDDGWIAVEATGRGLVWGDEEWMWNTEGHQTDYYRSYEAEDIYELYEGWTYEEDGKIVHEYQPIEDLNWWGPYCGKKAGEFIIKIVRLEFREAFLSLSKNPVDTV